MIQLSKIMHVDLSDYDESMLDIATDITHETGIGLTELKYGSRKPHVVRARTMFVKRAWPKFSSQQIADFLGFHRASVLHHQKKQWI